MSPSSRWIEYRALLGPLAVVALFGIGMVWSPFEPHRPPVEGAPVAPAPLTRSSPEVEPWAEADWRIFSERVASALDAGADTLPLGRAMAVVGLSFVGTPYAAGTLDADGPERVVIDFRGLDCVTFVENVYALTRYVRTVAAGSGGAAVPRATAERVYPALLSEIRYRDGRVGYPDRLHYFSEWIADNARRGNVADVTTSLGGIPDPEPIDFMSTHREAYRQLSDPAYFEAIREREAVLSRRGRAYVPEARIAAVADRIQDGDIIAATSTVRGLDVAHTGLALWVDGELRLLHAPLAGGAVQVSEVSLAERIARIGGQDGIMVARPLEPGR